MNSVSPSIDPTRTAELYGFDDVESYQQWHGLATDGVAGPITTTSMSQPRCGLPDFQLSREPEKASWPRNCMRVATAYRLNLNLDDDAIESAWDKALGLWSASCGLELSRIEAMQEANIWATSGPLPGSTLAWSYLPNGNCRERLEQRYDTTVTWNHDFLAKTILHEVGHAIGLTHSNRQSDIMYPSITGRTLSSYPSPNDKRRVVAYYGDSQDPTPPPPPPPGGNLLVIREALPKGVYELK